MVFDHEKLDVYRVSIRFVTWAFGLCQGLSGPNRHARDQLLRASQSVPQNIAEGNGKRSGADRRRFLEIARGSALECASILDILAACEAISASCCAEGKGLLVRVVAMLSRMAERVGEAREESGAYGVNEEQHDGGDGYDHEHRCAEHEHEKDEAYAGTDGHEHDH